jgi:formate dehydrogenase subunit gamma
MANNPIVCVKNLSTRAQVCVWTALGAAAALALFAVVALIASYAQTQSVAVYGAVSVENAANYSLGSLFAALQSEWFDVGFLVALTFVPIAGFLHYIAVGAKRFSHEGKKIFAFSLFMRVAHAFAALSFVVIVPTGFVMAFGDLFGGGAIVRLCKNLHGIATVFFAVSVLPIFFAWAARMLPAAYDVKWLLIVGGYLSKEKKPVPAGMFNAGQKMWFLIATIGGITMIATGAIMFFLANSAVSSLAAFLGVSHIDLLRGAAIVHNALGMLVAIFFMVHIYMSVFAVKGAIHSMISGYKEEEEVKILHSRWYQELKDKGEA